MLPPPRRRWIRRPPLEASSGPGERSGSAIPPHTAHPCPFRPWRWRAAARSLGALQAPEQPPKSNIAARSPERDARAPCPQKIRIKIPFPFSTKPDSPERHERFSELSLRSPSGPIWAPYTPTIRPKKIRLRDVSADATRERIALRPASRRSKGLPQAPKLQLRAPLCAKRRESITAAKRRSNLMDFE